MKTECKITLSHGYSDVPVMWVYDACYWEWKEENEKSFVDWSGRTMN